MKVLLPASALIVVAAIFLASREQGDIADLFTAEELATLGAGLKLDAPRFAGVTENGEAFIVRARWALPDSAMPARIELEAPSGEITLRDRELTGRAETGRIYRTDRRLTLSGNVVLETSDGYRIETDEIEIDLDREAVIARGPVTGSGPAGSIEAGSLRAVRGADTPAGAQIWFENRVRVVFIPAQTH